MRPPSERTIPTRNHLKLRHLFPRVTTQSYYFVRGYRSGIVRIGRRDEIVERLPLVKRNDLVHAAHTELFAVRLRDVMRGHLRIGPAEHRHHLAFGAVRISRHLGPALCVSRGRFSWAR